MRLFAGKTVSWMLGIAALLALAGLAAALGWVGGDGPGGEPGMVKSLLTSPMAEIDPAGPGQDLAPLPAPAMGAQALLTDSEPRAQGIATFQPQTSGVTPTQVGITPLEDWNPIRTQHTFTITVQDENGAPADGAEVEILLNRFGEAVGDIVALDGNNPRKVDNTFARVMTNADGQATLTITATRAGDTDVTAYVPQIANPEAHKVFAVKHWVDMQVEFPGDSVNLVGIAHPLPVRITRVTDGAPLQEVEVLFAITDDDPDGGLNGAGNSVSVRTDSNGMAEAVLRQATPATGENLVNIAVIHETGNTMFSRTISKEWRAPSLQVNKDGPSNLGLLKQDTYTVTVTNSGNRVASGVTLTDNLPSGLTLVSADPAPASTTATTATWNLGDLQPNAAVTITMTLSATAVGDQVNQATAVSTEGFTGMGQSTTAVIPGSLTLDKSAPAQVNIDGSLTYDITLTNDGQGALTNVVVTDTLPAGVTLASAPGASSGTSLPVQWNIERLDSGASQSFSVTATATATGDQMNTVAATSDEGATASATAVTRVVASDVSVTKAVNLDTVVLGESLTYTITVTNNGDGEATNVRVVDITPDGLTVTASNPQAGNDGEGNLLWMIDSLAAGASTSFTISADTQTPGLIRNISQVTDRDKTVQTEVLSRAVTPELSLTKTGNAGVYIGGEASYTITATNTGEAPLTGVTITDNFPPGMAYVSSDNNGIRNGNVVTWNIGSLDVGASAAVTVTLRGLVAGEVSNQARVTAVQNAEAEASLTIQVLATPGAHLSIVDTRDPLAVGEEGGYTIRLENQSSDSPISNVQITVTIPNELTILDAEGGTISGQRIAYSTITSLAAGATQNFRITVRANAEGNVVASATMSYDEFNQSITSQEGTTIITR